MAINEPRYRFHRAMVSGAPESAGLYALWRGAEMIFIARADSIRDALLDQLQRASELASHYTWHLSLCAADEEVDLLAKKKLE